MTRVRAAIAAAALAFLSACGQAPSPPDASAASAPVEAPESAFIRAAAQNDAYQLAASRVAVAQAGSERARAFAQLMEREHAASQSELAQIAASARLAAPAATLDENHQTYIDMMEEAPPAEFDVIYASQQVLLHQQIIAAYEGYLAQAPDGPLKT
ncbi:MAG: DUF4142 domain-containing protein, partial [Hyphomonadaceae bacterium]